MRMKLRVTICASILAISTCALGQDAGSAKSSQELAFNAALEAYNLCLTDASAPLLPDETKAPEVIAEEAGIACGKSYNVLSETHVRYMLSKASKASQLQAIAYSMNRMPQYRAELLGALAQKLASLRSPSAP